MAGAEEQSTLGPSDFPGLDADTMNRLYQERFGHGTHETPVPFDGAVADDKEN